MTTKRYEARPIRFYFTNTDLIACLSQGFVFATVNVFEQFIKGHTYQSFLKLYVTDPEATVKLVEHNAKYLEVDRVVSKFSRGTTIGLSNLFYRSLIRLAIDYKYKLTAEELIQNKAEAIFNVISSGANHVYVTIKNFSSSAPKGLVEGEAVVATQSIDNFPLSTLGWLDLKRAKKKSIKIFGRENIFPFC